MRGRKVGIVALARRLAIAFWQFLHDPEWLFDLKYDGFRALLYLEQGHVADLSHATTTR
jgi:hypothetical protein